MNGVLILCASTHERGRRSFGLLWKHPMVRSLTSFDNASSFVGYRNHTVVVDLPFEIIDDETRRLFDRLCKTAAYVITIPA